MNPQLYLWEGTRRSILERHDFYVDQVRARVLEPFADIEGEAVRYADREFERLGKVVNPETSDEGEVAEMANARAQEHYNLLSDLKMQVWLGALAGLFHQWDKDLREFLELELAHYVTRDEAQKLAWPSELSKVFDVLRDFGWDCTVEPFFRDVDACRLIVNVHKHGKGKSLDQLAYRCPEFLRVPFVPSLPGVTIPLDHEWLAVTAEQFDRLAGALRAFWTAFPGRLFLAGEA